MSDRSPTYEDYLWTEGGGTAGEFQAFCLALVENADVEEVATQLPVIEDLGVMGFPGELRFRSYDDWNEKRLLVGLFQMGSWTAMFEVNGFAGMTAELMIPLSKGRRIVSHHYSDGNGSGSFRLYEDGRLTANFNPTRGIYDLQARDRETLTSLMQASGFDQAPVDHPLEGRQHNRAATLALMERLTGVRLEPRTIADARFAVVRVALS
ncbi:DUF6461 domain-containing protein [Gordonia lacunae]|uniref:Uncharacterized protein n=1 Tax=Gordonia lacunae TaxID=417102 RepID=A0A243Q4Q7_9ACTN|nr:DUF6461 domain-containing protein [Gordonia lacunae]OUC75816.1 hypothetical protein CA982_24860 [Gordonia lacunae]